MAVKPLIILVHGMGVYPKPGPGVEGFTHEFISAANKTLNSFTGFKSKKIEKLAQVEEINYDSFFNKVRTDIADRAGTITDALTGVSGIDAVGSLPAIAFKLAALEQKFKDDDFFYTHVLDVVLYASILGGRVRTDVAEQFTRLIEKYPESPITVVAHSLGTAVIHDTLAKLYTGDFDALGSVASLDRLTHRIRSLWMLANVSKLVNAVTGLLDPQKSAVKPTPEGCTSKMRTVRHKLDPFTWIETFDPANDGGWISQDEYQVNFKSIVTSAITDFNTHSFAEYVKSPQVGPRLLSELFLDFRPSPDELNSYEENRIKATIPGAYEAMEEALHDIDVSKPATITTFVETAMNFHKTVKAMQEELDGKLDG
ncbi:MAG: hypothetical protein ACFHX7_12410 [Pseudomonadota bacterium]